MLEIRRADPTDPCTHAAVRRLLHRALPADLVDDRFDARWERASADASRGFVGSFGTEADDLVAYVGGMVAGDRLQLDAVIDLERTTDPNTLLDAVLDDVLSAPIPPGVSRVELWAKPAFDVHAGAAERAGFHPLRALHQMRCPLPTSVPALPTRSFQPGIDDEALRRLNNASFADHPDQGALSAADIAAKLAEPGVTPTGIRIHEIGGSPAGFCWTKVHDEPRVGEIYAIGLHPDHHGKGLGRGMTAAGLHWLHDACDLDTGMLYVEVDNDPAVRTYRGMGFEVARTDRAWSRPT